LTNNLSVILCLFQLLQDKIYIGLDHAPPAFDVKNKILGVGVSAS